MTQMIEIDGSYEEGGGAIIRTALAMSLLTQKPFRVTNIRKNRPEPGLKSQHLTAFEAIKQLAPTSKSSYVQLKETQAWFQPGPLKSGQFSFDIKTAGSISLFLQAMLLPCLFAAGKITITIQGGTCGKWQASVDYLQQILIPNLQRFTSKLSVKKKKRGYYPKGGGEIILEISPKIKSKQCKNYHELLEAVSIMAKPFNFIEQGKLEYIKGFVNTSQDLANRDVLGRVESAASSSLRSLAVPISIDKGYFPSKSTGGELLLWTLHSKRGNLEPNNCVRLAASELLETKKTAEEIGQNAAKKLKQLLQSSAAVDQYLADQLLIFMALLPGSKIKTNNITPHSKANIYVIEKFLPVMFKIDKNTISVSKNNSY